MKALIQNGLVIGLWDTPFEVHDSLQWVDATESCEAGGSYLKGVFTAPISLPEPTYAVKRIREYPAIGDQLDALFHAGVFPAEMAAAIQAIKDKYPKGSA
mgnify:CR=1 FL=1